MATITANTSRLSVVDKCQRGALIIALGTDNPKVPGNQAALAAFSSVQDELLADNAAVSLARAELDELLSRRDATENSWDQEIAQLAAFTQAATQSNETAMLSAGFGVRGTNARPQPLPAPKEVQALTNGLPGRTKLTWNVVDGAVIYMMEISTELTPENWKYLATSTRSSCEVDGAEPGQPAWFRVCAVNATGQGPWSAPARRPVM